MDKPQIIVPRRNFLTRALAWTTAGASMTVPIHVADDPQKRVDYHLGELTKALQEQFTMEPLVGKSRCVNVWQEISDPGDIIATVSARGRLDLRTGQYIRS